MIRTATMRALGPAEDQTLALFTDLQQWVDINGSSKRGKTTLMRALSFTLWGEDIDGDRLGADLVRDDADKMEAEFVLLNGLEAGRTMTRKRSITRSVRRPGKTEVSPDSEVKMRAALGPLGHDHDLARLVMFPMSWQADALTGGDRSGAKSRGRPLRDKLARILPAAPVVDVVARLMKEAGQPMREGDPLEEKAARKLQADANRDASTQRGAVDAIEAQIVKAEERAQTAARFSAEVVAGAQAVLDLSAAWSQYETHGAAVGAYEREVQALAAWKQRFANQGPRPDDNGAEITKATDWRNLARATAADKRRDLDRAGRALEDARRAERGLRAAPRAPDLTTTADARATLEAARKAAESAREQLDGARAWDPLTADEVIATRMALNSAAITADRATQDAAAPAPTGPCDQCWSEEWPKAAQRAAHLSDAADAAERDMAAAEEAHAAAIRAAEDRKAHHIADCEADFQRFAAEAVAAREALLDAERASEEAAEQARVAAMNAAAIATQQATAAFQRAEEAECEAGVVLERAEAARDAAVKAGTAAREWDAAAEALGAKPTVRPAPAAAGTPPEKAKPTGQQIDAARQTLREASEATGAAGQRLQAIDDLRADLTEATTRRDRAVSEAARCAALLKSILAAPSEAVRASIEGLDAGPVTLKLEGTGVKVLVDGRRWQIASDGELVVADLAFRAALRPHLQLSPGRPATYLPLFVDRAQAVAGLKWPDVPGPVVRFWTAEGDIEVTRHAGRPA